MLMVQTTVSALTRRSLRPSPADVLQAVNDVIYDNLFNRLGQRTFVTLTLLHHDGHGGFTFAGGHEEIVVLRAATSRCERIDTPGPWIGAAGTIQHMLVVSRLQLEPGDLLFLYTDGITQARDARGEQFGMDRLCGVVEERPDRPLDELCSELLERVARWHVRQEDDLTAMAIRYRGAGAVGVDGVSSGPAGPSSSLVSGTPRKT
jgi:sigma-B regulation protein RsbU (phosphoserine phosphatase)